LSESDRPALDIEGVVYVALTKQLWPVVDPLGKTLVFVRGTDRATFTIVGVVRDIPPVRPGDPIEPQLYWSNRQVPRPFTFVVVRSTVPPASLTSAIRARVRGVDRDLEPRSIRTMPDLMSGELKTPRFTMLLVIAFGGAALLLAAIGTYSLLSYIVAQRTREIGIRIALGAQRREIIASVMAAGLALVGAGIALGLGGAVAASQVLRGVLAGVSATDPVTLGATAGILVVVAVLACLLPAWRASRVDPMTALRTE